MLVSSKGERESERERERANGKGKGCKAIKEFKRRGGQDAEQREPGRRRREEVGR